MTEGVIALDDGNSQQKKIPHIELADFSLIPEEVHFWLRRDYSGIMSLGFILRTAIFIFLVVEYSMKKSRCPWDQAK